MHLSSGEILTIVASGVFVSAFLIFYLVRMAVRSVIRTQTRSVRRELATQNRLLVRLLRGQGLPEHEINQCFLDDPEGSTKVFRKQKRNIRSTESN